MSGHTHRRVLGRSHTETKLQFSNVERSSMEHGGAFECEISEIDSFFYKGFLTNKNYTRGGNLNKNNVFAYIIDELEHLALHTDSVFDKRANAYQTTYHIPVIGFQLFSKASEEDSDNLYSGEKRAMSPKVSEGPFTLHVLARAVLRCELHLQAR